MIHDASTESWNSLGSEWISLAQEEDSTRMVFIMPYMLELMGDVKGKSILDLGCGEGGYSRELTKKAQKSQRLIATRLQSITALKRQMKKVCPSDAC